MSKVVNIRPKPPEKTKHLCEGCEYPFMLLVERGKVRCGRCGVVQVERKHYQPTEWDIG